VCSSDLDDEVDPTLARPFIGNYHKGLEHDSDGIVNITAYNQFRNILESRDESRFPTIPLDRGRKLTNPLAGLAEDREMPSPKYFRMLQAPKVTSDEAAAEAVELYWMALLRDVSFRVLEHDGCFGCGPGAYRAHRFHRP